MKVVKLGGVRVCRVRACGFDRVGHDEYMSTGSVCDRAGFSERTRRVYAAALAAISQRFASAHRVP